MNPLKITVETAAAADLERGWSRRSAHRTLAAAIKAAARARSDGSVVARVSVSGDTLTALLASGAVYRTAQGEIIDREMTASIVAVAA